MINLYGHGGSGNHGCEAIVRSTTGLLNQRTRLFSSHPDQDLKYEINDICEVLCDPDEQIAHGGFQWFSSSVQTKLTGSIDLQIRYRRNSLLSKVHRGDIFFSIGGDNYCYAGTENIAALNRNMKRRGAKIVLWGCSVEPDLLKNKDVAEDISQFDYITARESISYEALRKVNPNTILVTDPAFALERVDRPLPVGWIEGNTIGINVSPLILNSNQNQSTILDAFRKLIQCIISETDCSIALIPHVVWPQNDDRVPLNVLYKEFEPSKRVVLLDDYNCMELKGYIARCRMFIGARTHATIAAYSSNVPTVVLGYSVKSKGIARDIFGTEDKYVISASSIQTTDELVNAFHWLCDNEKDIRNHLTDVMPQYRQKAYLAVSSLPF